MKRLQGFLAGVIATLLVAAIGVTALAANGMTITVNPINVMVDGSVFKPKDAGGNDVLVFEYNGTTYAPLRALAEAFGLEVGYNHEERVATVVKPGNAPQGAAEPEIDSGTKTASINGVSVNIEVQNNTQYARLRALQNIVVKISEYNGLIVDVKNDVINFVRLDMNGEYRFLPIGEVDDEGNAIYDIHPHYDSYSNMLAPEYEVLISIPNSSDRITFINGVRYLDVDYFINFVLPLFQ